MYKRQGLRRAGFDARDAGSHGELNGDASCNIVNRTLLGMGAQLELSKPLRDAMFTEHTRAGRKHTTTELFWTFVAACRDALDRLQAGQIAVRPDLKCRKDDPSEMGVPVTTASGTASGRPVC